MIRTSSTPAPDANGCWVGIEPPRIRAEAEELDDFVRDSLLAVDREASDQERVVHFGVAELGDQRHELGLELVEDLARLRPCVVYGSKSSSRMSYGSSTPS